MMKRFLFAAIALVAIGVNTASAATVELSRGDGLAGDLVTLYLTVDHVPVDEFGGFSLDLDLVFDPAKVQYMVKSAKKVGIFRDEADSSGAPPPSDFSEIRESPKPNRLSLGLLGSYFLGAPAGGGSLVSLDFLVAADAGNGEIPIIVELTSSSNNGVSSARSGAIGVSAVPVPPALVLLGAPLAWMFSRLRRS